MVGVLIMDINILLKRMRKADEKTLNSQVLESDNEKLIKLSKSKLTPKQQYLRQLIRGRVR